MNLTADRDPNNKIVLEEKSTGGDKDDDFTIDEDAIDVQPLLELTKTVGIPRSVKSELLGVKKTEIVKFMARKK